MLIHHILPPKWNYKIPRIRSVFLNTQFLPIWPVPMNRSNFSVMGSWVLHILHGGFAEFSFLVKNFRHAPPAQALRFFRYVWTVDDISIYQWWLGWRLYRCRIKIQIRLRAERSGNKFFLRHPLEPPRLPKWNPFALGFRIRWCVKIFLHHRDIFNFLCLRFWVGLRTNWSFYR